MTRLVEYVLVVVLVGIVVHAVAPVVVPLWAAGARVVHVAAGRRSDVTRLAHSLGARP